MERGAVRLACLCAIIALLAVTDSGALPGGRALAAEELPAFEIIVRDGVFTPARIGVPAGRRVKLILINEGPGPLEFENDEMHIEKVLNAGARSFVVLPKLKPGAYEFVDEFNPITGLLVVEAK